MSAVEVTTNVPCCEETHCEEKICVETEKCHDDSCEAGKDDVGQSHEEAQQAEENCDHQEKPDA